MKRRTYEIHPSGGDDTTAIDEALATHRSVRLREGFWHYGKPRLKIPKGRNVYGCGAGVTVVDRPIELNSFCTVGGYSEDVGITFGMPSTNLPNIFSTGVRDIIIGHCRFRWNGNFLWDPCDYTARWSDSVVRRRCDVRDVIWTFCDFEHGAMDLFSIWWDCRSGGGRVSGLEWYSCTFGALNADGAHSGGRVRLLIQPSPPEHASDGPRPPRSRDGWSGKCANFEFDWSQIDHGSGLASGHDNPNPFIIQNCVFTGEMRLAPFVHRPQCNPVDTARPSVMWPQQISAALLPHRRVRFPRRDALRRDELSG